MNQSTLYGKSVSWIGAGAALSLLFFASGEAGAATTITVPGDHATIAAALAAASNGDTIVVSAGTYTENLTLSKDVTLEGAKAGVDACGRDGTGETVIDASSSVGIGLISGVAGATIDGFTIVNTTRAIESFSGPLHGLTIQNNRLPDSTSGGMFLNDVGDDITLHQNLVDNTSAGGGTAIHLDTDAMDGMHITDNCISNADTGLFSDGNRNVGTSASRSPLLSGNLFSMNGAGANLGRKSWEYATISNNIFTDNTFDGLQGGPAFSEISGNVFTKNLRVGLRLTGFGTPTDSTRGAQDNDIHSNCIVGNGGGVGAFYPYTGGIRYDVQYAGTQASNMTNGNNIYGNTTRGASYVGLDTVDAENNWWGASDGPSAPDGTGSGDSVDGTTGGGSIDFTPYETSGLDLPCNDYFPLTCQGFEPPMNFALLPPALGGGPIARRVGKNRAFPFKATLVDGIGNVVTELVSPPRLWVVGPAPMVTSVDVTEDAYTNGKRTDGDAFLLAGDKWIHNLASRGFAAPGTYTATMISGNEDEYLIDPTCTALFLIEP